MKITRKVRKAGNSLVVSFPPLMLQIIDVDLNDNVNIEYCDDKSLKIRPADKEDTGDYIGSNN